MKDDRFTMKVVNMYYKNGMSQVAIGKKLNVSRMTVARVLDQARKNSYVQITINYPKDSVTNEEEILENKFHLKEAMIAYPKEDENIMDEIGYLISDYLIRVIKDHMTLAMTSGTTMQKVTRYLQNDMRLRMKKFHDIKIVPLSGENNVPDTADEDYRLAYSNYLIDIVAQTLKVQAFGVMAPLLVTDKQARDKFMEEKSVSRVIEMAEEADVALFGIGSLDLDRNINTDTISREEYGNLKKQGGVGEVFCHVFDKDGQFMKNNLDQRLIAVSFEKLKQIPVRAGVAFGKEKRQAILGALRGGIVNVLITDKETADYLIEA